MKQLQAWLAAPAVDAPRRAQEVALSGVRVLLGLMWLYNVAWKRAPDFGEEAGNGLYKFASLAVEHPVLPPFSWLVENLVLPNITVFGYLVLLVETALAVLLLTGTWVRLAAALGIGQSVAIALSVAFAPEEWPWSYWLMIGAHVAVLVGPSARAWGADAVRAGLSPARLLTRSWGVLALLVGAYSALLSLDDPLAAPGPGLRSTDLSMSLGQYNLVGGLVLAVVGALLLVADRSRPAAGAAAGLGLVAALSIHVQIPIGDPLLGGTPTSAAVLFSLALVAAVALTGPRRTAS